MTPVPLRSADPTNPNYHTFINTFILIQKKFNMRFVTAVVSTGSVIDSGQPRNDRKWGEWGGGNPRVTPLSLSNFITSTNCVVMGHSWKKLFLQIYVAIEGPRNSNSCRHLLPTPHLASPLWKAIKHAAVFIKADTCLRIFPALFLPSH